MKKFFALTAILTLILAACDQPTNNNQEQKTKLPSFTIKNESSFVLTNITYANVPFSDKLAP